MAELENPTKKNNGFFIIITILLLIGLAVLSYFFSKKNSELNACINHNTALTTDMNGMNEMMTGYVGNMSNDLTKDFQNMLNTYDDLILKDFSTSINSFIRSSSTTCLPAVSRITTSNKFF